VREVMVKLRAMRLTKAAELVEAKAHETLTYFAFPSNHWRQVKINNPLERIIREIRRRTRVVGAFPDGHSALMLVAARLRHIASTGASGVTWRWKRCSTRFLRRQPLEIGSGYRHRKCERLLTQPPGAGRAASGRWD
jgi:transposase-like protein